MNLISVDDAKKLVGEQHCTFLKYVRLSNNRYILALDGEWCTPKHNQMIQKDDKAISAGYVAIRRNMGYAGLEVEGYSSTLKLFPASDDAANLAKLLGVKERHPS